MRHIVESQLDPYYNQALIAVYLGLQFGMTCNESVFTRTWKFYPQCRKKSKCRVTIFSITNESFLARMSCLKGLGKCTGSLPFTIRTINCNISGFNPSSGKPITSSFAFNRISCASLKHPKFFSTQIA